MRKKKFRIAIPELPVLREELPEELLEECELLEGEKGVRGDNEQLLKLMGTADAVIFNSSNSVTAELMKMGPELKIAFKSGSRPENIDFDYAREHGIAVGWTPDANSQSVAEYTVLLMLAACKQFQEGIQAVAEGRWRDGTGLGGDLAGSTIGLIGLGPIGRRTAALLKGFQARLIACSPHAGDEVFQQLGIARVSLEELLEQSDIVSLHCAVTEDTRGMLGAEAFSRMKSSAILVNTARGALIDEAALVHALENGQIRAAALDVYASEPLAENHPLRRMDQVILTPHAAARTRRSAWQECVWAIRGALDYLQGRELCHVTVIFPDQQGQKGER